MWEVQEDRSVHLLTVRVTSVLNEGDLIRTKLALKHRMATLRAVRGSAHILFDLTGYDGATAAVISQFEHVDGDFVQDAADRVAIVLPSSLDKAAARPLLKWPAQSSLFVSANAAKMWLQSA